MRRMLQGHRRIVFLSALVCVFLVRVAHGAGAQVAYDGKRARVEVLGLRHWTVHALEDSIRRRVPGQTLEDAACMVTLRDSLHFADALVLQMVYPPARAGGAEKRYLVIKVVEPQEAARVQWRPAPHDSFTVLRPTYAAVIIPATDSLGQLRFGGLMDPLQFYGRDSVIRAAAMRGRREAERDDAARLWHFLDEHRSEDDRRTALTALRRDGPYANRIVAAAVLANFADQDSTWWALADALRDGNEAVRIAALTVLRGLPARPVDWATAAPTLRALLGGANVGATQDVLELLDRTEVSAALARPLLRQNGNWVLTHLRAEYPGAKYFAHALLVRLNGGRDLGATDVAWANWLEAL